MVMRRHFLYRQNLCFFTSFFISLLPFICPKRNRSFRRHPCETTPAPRNTSELTHLALFPQNTRRRHFNLQAENIQQQEPIRILSRAMVNPPWRLCLLYPTSPGICVLPLDFCRSYGSLPFLSYIKITISIDIY